MKWYKRFSNALIAIIAVVAVVAIVFVVTAVIVPKTRQNKSADGFFTALFKDPPKNEEIITDQDKTTGLITLKLKNKSDYSLLEIKLTLVEPNKEHQYSDNDVITCTLPNGKRILEQKILTFKDIKKGENVCSETFQPQELTLENYKKYEILIEVVRYK